MPDDDLQRLLRSGIEAAQSGRHADARALFDQVIARDPDQELAWLWKATVAETVDERRACLRRVLVINPENLQAGQALERLARQATPGPSADRAALLPRDAPPRRSYRRLATGLIAGGVALIALGAVLIAGSLLGGPAEPTPDPAARPAWVLTVTGRAPQAPAYPATATPLGGEVRTIPARAPELPATWTPTATWTPSAAGPDATTTHTGEVQTLSESWPPGVPSPNPCDLCSKEGRHP